MEVSKSDWNLFRKKLAGWQEKFMGKLCTEYAAILSDSNMKSSEKFWALRRRIEEDKYLSGVQVKMVKSNICYDLVRLIKEEAILFEDLSEFSPELQENVKWILRG